MLKSLNGLDTHKSINGIPNIMMKECAQVLHAPLTLLFRRICRDGEFPDKWKLGRITALHKRGLISKPEQYRPVTMLLNIELVFEDVVLPQLYKFLEKFIPPSQFGFLKACGTQDFGALLVLKIFLALERGSDVLLVSLDVAGAFDRVWHAGLLKKLKAAGMSSRALRLMKGYLQKRYIQVVVGDERSKIHEIFSSVPQGGKWSAPLWDFEIATLEDLDLTGLLFSYADDCSLFYEITKENKASITAAVNSDLKQLENWGVEWLTTFEPTKTHSMVISRKSKINTFDPSGIVFIGKAIEAVEEMKLVGFIFDKKMTMEKMVNHVKAKAKVKLAAIFRLKQHLDSHNLESMYKAFVRSSIEYGNLEYLSAAQTHTRKLDRIQASAEKLGGFKVESLSSRREAALIGFIMKLLDGDGRGALNEFTPELYTHKHTRNNSRFDQGSRILIKEAIRFESATDHYNRSIGGRAAEVWSKIPSDLIEVGKSDGWQNITKQCQRFLTGKKLAEKHSQKHTKKSKQVQASVSKHNVRF